MGDFKDLLLRPRDRGFKSLRPDKYFRKLGRGRKPETQLFVLIMWVVDRGFPLQDFTTFNHPSAPTKSKRWPIDQRYLLSFRSIANRKKGNE